MSGFFCPVTALVVLSERIFYGRALLTDCPQNVTRGRHFQVGSLQEESIFSLSLLYHLENTKRNEKRTDKWLNTECNPKCKFSTK